jgi:hypothetical protein
MFPWENYNFLPDGSAKQNKTKNQKLDRITVNNLWINWYTHIIDPYKQAKFAKSSMYLMDIDNMPGLKIDLDHSTTRNKPSKFCLSIVEIIGLYLMSFDIDMAIHKKTFIEVIKQTNKLVSVNGLDQMFESITEFMKRKRILQNKSNTWIYYDSTINHLVDKKHKFEPIDSEMIIIKIKMLGSSMYDKLSSYDSMLYLYLEPKYPDRYAIYCKYYNWTINRKIKL